MALSHVTSLTGFLPVCVTQDLVLGLTRKGIACWSLIPGKIEVVARIEAPVLERVFGSHRLIRRALRRVNACGTHLGDHRFIVADRQCIRFFDLTTGETHVEKYLVDGMRPLKLTQLGGLPGFEAGVYYGDYGPNNLGRPIGIHHRIEGGAWRCVYTFPAGTVEHVHAIIRDSIRECAWIFTGDYGNAAAIWSARNGFRQVEPVLQGRQIGRACNGFAEEDGLLYATDSHTHANSIRLLRPVGHEWESIELHPMVGSSVHGGKFGQLRIFTTAFEPREPTGNYLRDLLDHQPGPGIVSKYCELVVGNTFDGFRTELSWEADRMPKRLFQLSTMVIPDLDIDAALLPVFGLGVKGHDAVTEIFRI